jgi:hypothetical protein
MFFAIATNVPHAAALRDYLLFLFLSFFACRFGECHPQETARIDG